MAHIIQYSTVQYLHVCNLFLTIKNSKSSFLFYDGFLFSSYFTLLLLGQNYSDVIYLPNKAYDSY